LFCNYIPDIELEVEAARKSHNPAFSLAGNKVSDPSTVSIKGT